MREPLFALTVTSATVFRVVLQVHAADFRACGETLIVADALSVVALHTIRALVPTLATVLIVRQ